MKKKKRKTNVTNDELSEDLNTSAKSRKNFNFSKDESHKDLNISAKKDKTSHLSNNEIVSDESKFSSKNIEAENDLSTQDDSIRNK